MYLPLTTSIVSAVDIPASSSETAPLEPRRKLPVVPMLSTGQSSDVNKAFDCFTPISPSVQTTTTEAARFTSGSGQKLPSLITTPLTALRVPAVHKQSSLSPVIATPVSAVSQSSNMSLLDRYLIETEKHGDSRPHISSSENLLKTGVDQGIPETAIYRPYLRPTGSDVNASSELFSPISGDWPADRFDIGETHDQITSPELQFATNDEPLTLAENKIGSSTDRSQCMNGVVATSAVDASQSHPIYQEEAHHVPRQDNSGPEQTILLPLESNCKVSPQDADATSQTTSLGVPIASPAVDHFSRDLPEFIEPVGSSRFDPPPAPKIAEFPIHRSPSRSPTKSKIDTSGRIEQWRKMTVTSGSSDFQNSMKETKLSSAVEAIPAPGPMDTMFGVELPASPIRSKPAPIDTSRKTDRSAEPTSQSMRSAPLGSATMSSGMPTPRSIGDTSAGYRKTSFSMTSPGGSSKAVRFNITDANRFTPPNSASFKIPISPGIPEYSQQIPYETDYGSPKLSPQMIRPASRGLPIATDPAADSSSSKPSRESKSLFRKISPTLALFSFSRNRGEGRGLLGRRHSSPQTPQVTGRGVSQQANTHVPDNIPVLPNTALNAEIQRFFTTRDQIKSEQYFVLHNHLQTGAEKRRGLGLESLDTLVKPVSTSSTSRPLVNPGDLSAIPASAESAGSNDWWG